MPLRYVATSYYSCSHIIAGGVSGNRGHSRAQDASEPPLETRPIGREAGGDGARQIDCHDQSHTRIGRCRLGAPTCGGGTRALGWRQANRGPAAGENHRQDGIVDGARGSPVTLYLETSSLVKLYVTESGSEVVRQLVDKCDVVATSVVAYPETRAALARLRREGVLTAAKLKSTRREFDEQ